MTTDQWPKGSKTVWNIGAVWLAIAILAGRLGLIARLRPPFPQLVLFGLTALLFLVFLASGSFRAWASAVDLRYMIGLHITRFVGFYFLVLHARGELPYAFAVPGGWGDIIVAIGAMLVIVAPFRSARSVRVAYLVWNYLGLIDILLVVVTAARLGFRDPASMQALLQFPLSLLPTFRVPIIIFTHGVIFWRLGRSFGSVTPE